MVQHSEESGSNVKKNIINITMIDKTTQESIARTFLPLVEDYFTDPKVKSEYEKWLQKRSKISV